MCISLRWILVSVWEPSRLRSAIFIGVPAPTLRNSSHSIRFKGRGCVNTFRVEYTIFFFFYIFRELLKEALYSRPPAWVCEGETHANISSQKKKKGFKKKIVWRRSLKEKRKTVRENSRWRHTALAVVNIFSFLLFFFFGFQPLANGSLMIVGVIFIDFMYTHSTHSERAHFTGYISCILPKK